MNKEKVTWHQRWQVLKEYCHREKTIFDFKDRAKALLGFVIICYCLFKLVEWLVN